MTPNEMIKAMQYPKVVYEPIKHGLWTLWQRQTPSQLLNTAKYNGWDYSPRQTVLSLHNWAGLHLKHGEIVMDDSPNELQRHLEFVMNAKGRILKTGLGLGCVVRGLLAKDNVEHIDVVEIVPWIAETIGEEFKDNPRVTIYVADAHTWDFGDRKWDYVWHDIHQNGDEDSNLQLQHAKLMVRYMDVSKRQGAWAFPRDLKKQINKGSRPLIG